MTHLEVTSGRLGLAHRRVEDLPLMTHGRVVGLVGIREVRPQPDDSHHSLGLEHPGCRDQVGEVRCVRAVSAQAGVDLDVDPGGAAQFAGGGGHLVQGPRRGHRDVDVAEDRTRVVGAGHMQPAEQRSLDPAVPQRDRLGEQRRAEPAGAAAPRGPRARHQPVPVRVGLDHREQVGGGGVLAQDPHIGLDRAQVDVCRGRGAVVWMAVHLTIESLIPTRLPSGDRPAALLRRPPRSDHAQIGLR